MMENDLTLKSYAIKFDFEHFAYMKRHFLKTGTRVFYSFSRVLIYQLGLKFCPECHHNSQKISFFLQIGGSGS